MFNRVQALDKELKIIQGQFTHNSTVAVLIENKSPGVKSVTQGATGNIAIVLGTPSGDTDIYPHFYNGMFTYQNASAHGGTVGFHFQIKSSTINSDGTLNIFTLDKNGAATNLPTNTTVHFTLILKNSNVAGVGAGSV